MQSQFIGNVKTLWETNHRDMKLLESFAFIDPSGKEWAVPAGSFLNGATIPRALWTIVGSPYTGSYRRATVLHDYFVGEGSNDDVSHGDRRKADKMFYHACRHDGCSWRQAVILYLGVSVGTFFSKRYSADVLFESEPENIHETPTDIEVKDKFYKLYYNLEGDFSEEKITSDLKPQTEKSRTEEPERFFINSIEQKVNLLLAL